MTTTHSNSWAVIMHARIYMSNNASSEDIQSSNCQRPTISLRSVKIVLTSFTHAQVKFLASRFTEEENL